MQDAHGGVRPAKGQVSSDRRRRCGVLGDRKRGADERDDAVQRDRRPALCEPADLACLTGSRQPEGSMDLSADVRRCDAVPMTAPERADRQVDPQPTAGRGLGVASVIIGVVALVAGCVYAVDSGLTLLRGEVGIFMLTSAPFLPVVACALALVGFILGIVAQRRTRPRSGPATVGTVISGIAIGVLFVPLFIVFALWAMSQP